MPPVSQCQMQGHSMPFASRVAISERFSASVMTSVVASAAPGVWSGVVRTAVEGGGGLVGWFW